MSLKFKHHILTHYETITKRTGPPKESNAMRYEGKHKEFKNISRQTNNYQNMTKYLATHH